MGFVAFVKTHLAIVVAGIVIVISAITLAIIIIMQSTTEETIKILEAGAEDVPFIKQEDLDILAETYSILNEQFEREINSLTSGEANRHNKMDKTIEHYGVNGKDNVDPFKNNDYVNGIKINYEKGGENGVSNFNDIISVMSIIYEQKMDKIEIDELKKRLTKLFWASHTYTYDSDELYPCKSGCIAENNYNCTGVYNEYKNTKYLKYDLFNVQFHNNYAGFGYEEKEDFRIVLPTHMCTVHGTAGAGCIWDENKICFHGNGAINLNNCNLKITVPTSLEVDDGEQIEYSILGDTVIPEDVESRYLAPESTTGQKVDKSDTTCKYYKTVKYCNTRKNLAENIRTLTKDKLKQEQNIMKQEEKWSEGEHSEEAEENFQKKIMKLQQELNKTMMAIDNKRAELENHINTTCETNETSSKYWCDGYKICLGHKEHYKCDGKHKIVLCSGHTNINVSIKILYGNELMEEALKILG